MFNKGTSSQESTPVFITEMHEEHVPSLDGRNRLDIVLASLPALAHLPGLWRGSRIFGSTPSASVCFVTTNPC